MMAKRSRELASSTHAERAWLIGDTENEGFTSFGKPGDDN
jgi:hypothetical protein